MALRFRASNRLDEGGAGEAPAIYQCTVAVTFTCKLSSCEGGDTFSPDL
jgi:hypothetical protein